nr:histidine kinase [Bacteroidota bacterium]
MKKPALIDIFSNPFFLAAIFILPGLIYVETRIPIFISETISNSIISQGEIYHYDDLDSDGHVELIRTKRNANGQAALVIEKNSKILRQINLLGEYAENSTRITFGDYNSDGIKEIFTLTHINAKIWLHYINIFDSINSEIFIDSVWLKNGEYDFSASFYDFIDMNGDGSKELLLHINGGFSVYPRKIYYYDIKKDSLVKSSTVGSKISINQIADIDNDSHPEVLINSRAVDNMMGKYNLPFPDDHSWIVALDDKLQFKFPPVEGGGVYTHTELYYVSLEKGKMLFSSHYSNSREKVIKPRNILLKKLSRQGHTELENEISIKDLDIKMNLLNENQFLIFEQDQIYTIDTLLQKHKFIKNKNLNKLTPHFSHLYKSGAYYVFSSKATNQCYFGDHGFNHIVPINANKSISSISQCDSINGNPHFAVQTGNELTHFIVKKNPNYVFRIGYYAGAYLLLLLFIMLIQWIQRKQTEKKHQLEKEMGRLQFASLKNQLDPHFTMNVLNSISTYVLKNSPDAAYNYIVRFSRMIHSTLKQSDVFVRSLQEEVNFVTDYLELQKLRFKGMLEYEIKISRELDPEIEIPKLLIQSHVENAIKHGLQSREGKGKIRIEVEKYHKQIRISISDNGIGRKAAGQMGTTGTGKGLATMQKYYDIFHTFTGRKIRQEIEDLFDKAGNPSGTMVVIRVEVSEKHL